MCNDSMPIPMTLHAKKKVKERIKIVQNMKFTKVSSKVHCLLSSTPDRFNVSTNTSEDYRAGFQNEKQLAQEMEDNTLLQDALVSNNVLHGRETAFGIFLRKCKKSRTRKLQSMLEDKMIVNTVVNELALDS